MIKEIKNNFQKLIALYEAQKEKSDYLSAELSRCIEEKKVLEKQITDLKGQIDQLKLGAAFTAQPEGQREARERIDRLIREIDKCIAQLGE